MENPAANQSKTMRIMIVLTYDGEDAGLMERTVAAYKACPEYGVFPDTLWVVAGIYPSGKIEDGVTTIRSVIVFQAEWDLRENPEPDHIDDMPSGMLLGRAFRPSAGNLLVISPDISTVDFGKSTFTWEMCLHA